MPQNPDCGIVCGPTQLPSVLNLAPPLPPLPSIAQIELLPHGVGPAGEDVVASLYGSDVVLSNARNGQVIRLISCGEGEVRAPRLVWLCD